MKTRRTALLSALGKIWPFGSVFFIRDDSAAMPAEEHELGQKKNNCTDKEVYL